MTRLIDDYLIVVGYVRSSDLQIFGECMLNISFLRSSLSPNLLPRGSVRDSDQKRQVSNC